MAPTLHDTRQRYAPGAPSRRPPCPRCNGAKAIRVCAAGHQHTVDGPPVKVLGEVVDRKICPAPPRRDGAAYCGQRLHDVPCPACDGGCTTCDGYGAVRVCPAGHRQPAPAGTRLWRPSPAAKADGTTPDAAWWPPDCDHARDGKPAGTPGCSHGTRVYTCPDCKPYANLCPTCGVEQGGVHLSGACGPVHAPPSGHGDMVDAMALAIRKGRGGRPGPAAAPTDWTGEPPDRVATDWACTRPACTTRYRTADGAPPPGAAAHCPDGHGPLVALVPTRCTRCKWRGGVLPGRATICPACGADTVVDDPADFAVASPSEARAACADLSLPPLDGMVRDMAKMIADSMDRTTREVFGLDSPSPATWTRTCAVGHRTPLADWRDNRCQHPAGTDGGACGQRAAAPQPYQDCPACKGTGTTACGQGHRDYARVVPGDRRCPVLVGDGRGRLHECSKARAWAPCQTCLDRAHVEARAAAMAPRHRVVATWDAVGDTPAAPPVPVQRCTNPGCGFARVADPTALDLTCPDCGSTMDGPR